MATTLPHLLRQCLCFVRSFISQKVRSFLRNDSTDEESQRTAYAEIELQDCANKDFQARRDSCQSTYTELTYVESGFDKEERKDDNGVGVPKKKNKISSCYVLENRQSSEESYYNEGNASEIIVVAPARLERRASLALMTFNRSQ